MNKNIKNFVIAGLTLSALTAGSISAFAASNTTTSNTTNSVSSDLQPDFKGEKHKMDFSSLVSNGTISQATADKITAYIEEEKAKIDAMTESEKQAYFTANKSDRIDKFTKMVTAGVITQQEADAIKAAMPAPSDDGLRRGHGMKFDTTSLVTNGVIDQEVADKITAYMTQKQTDRQNEKAKIDAMTESEKQAYFTTNKATRVDPFTEMVTAGVITQAQADAIKAAMPARPLKTDFK